MSHHNENIAAAHDHHDHGGMDKKGIWKVFFILLALTALEFLIALGFVHHWGVIEKGMVLNTIYIVLTLVKAYYIVAYFMHLKFEKSGFILCCAIGFIFIVYFIILLLIEGDFLLYHLHSHPLFPSK
ncbi:caa(3)-type oxidase subunit IV [Sphingobacterium allocomposti]|jgi:cytochrome c oxidase subunit 4|uniref:Caa(3)-type oxidase subunit IV n=1 Tax=Sphingobacterium allocomposti TaxID=415956 RepID=A0A5S5DV89_9SPHI|nr:cytochrome C oxidase subunit IV family protein [Sphingobacterium composti Yoo et al. 2007 non Ten et al. 2007]TYP98539.1 caa(3)-type oxidase subunit IV [Sphingobacterium composti Yoo et al. 2007 non Ten et al. 2007]HLS95464.1 cytochrome C oxidase subunit IV family protein [Sphingobacterium sp.]